MCDDRLDLGELSSPDAGDSPIECPNSLCHSQFAVCSGGAVRLRERFVGVAIRPRAGPPGEPSASQALPGARRPQTTRGPDPCSSLRLDRPRTREMCRPPPPLRSFDAQGRQGLRLVPLASTGLLCCWVLLCAGDDAEGVAVAVAVAVEAGAEGRTAAHAVRPGRDRPAGAKSQPRQFLTAGANVRSATVWRDERSSADGGCRFSRLQDELGRRLGLGHERDV